MARMTRRAVRRTIGGTIAASILLVVLLCFSCMQRPPVTQVPRHATLPTGEPRPVRVLLVDRAPGATLAASARYTIAPSGTLAKGAPRILAQGTSLPEATVRVTPAALTVGSRHFPDDELLIATDSDGALAVDGRRYRGKLLLRRMSDDQLRILNIVPIDHYLWSVLGSETYASWPAAALEAQAIVARSYAMWRMAERRHEPFDLYATVMDQNYLGVAKEDARLRAAVDRTEGAVLLYQMKLFRCYYHSTCGGQTEDVENAFPDPPLLPLSGVPCRYCGDSKHFHWKREITKAELASALRSKGFTISRLTSIKVLERSRSGRAKALAIGTSRGPELTMSAAEFRLAVGARRVPSTRFDLTDLGASYQLRGQGWGHGVGMCQWGSKGMADAGYAAEEILEHYYPGAQLVRLYATDAHGLLFPEENSGWAHLTGSSGSAGDPVSLPVCSSAPCARRAFEATSKPRQAGFAF